MKQILVLEDDYMLSSGLCYNLELEGYQAVPVYTLKEAIEASNSEKFDLMLLDVNLPDGNGFDFCNHVRKTQDMPVIFLTASDLEEEMLKGFDLGADDYITKPFNIKILLKKVAVYLMRAQKQQVERNVYRCQDLEVDYDRLTVASNGEEIPLTPTEYKLLKILTSNPNSILTRQVFLDKLWDYDENYVDEHTLTVNINRLRSKLEKEERKYIKTVYGIGYSWIGEK